MMTGDKGTAVALRSPRAGRPNPVLTARMDNQGTIGYKVRDSWRNQMQKKYNPAMVTLAREMRGLTQTELATKLSVPQGTISKLESGALFFTEEIANGISEALQFPQSFFSQTDAVYPFGSTTFYHRRLQSVPASILRRIEAKVNVYRFHIAIGYSFRRTD